MALREEGYWDEHYNEELRNYEDNGDEGEVWFGKGLSRRICKWIIYDYCIKQNRTAPKILDIGCGNGFLIKLILEEVEKNATSEPLLDIKKFKIVGIDYSANSIKLTEQILKIGSNNYTVQIKQCDFLNIDAVRSSIGTQLYNIAVDIGTYDAICLLACETQEKLTTAKHQYMKSLYSVMSSDSVFILASCNHTREELEPILEFEKPPGLKYEIAGVIDSPSFTFGGKEGRQVTCLIIKFVNST